MKTTKNKNATFAQVEKMTRERNSIFEFVRGRGYYYFVASAEGVYFSMSFYVSKVGSVSLDWWARALDEFENGLVDEYGELWV